MHTRWSQRRSRAFTLVDSLIVTAIGVLLIGVLVPTIQHSRELARKSQCLTNLRQIGLAMSTYEKLHSMYPFTQGISCNNWPNGQCQTTMNWGIAILPQLNQAATYNQYNQYASFADPQNACAIATVVSAFICPSAPRASNLTTMNMTARAISNVANSDPEEPSGNFIPFGVPMSATGGATDYVISSGVKAHLMSLVFPADNPILQKLTIDGSLKDSWGFGRPGEWMVLSNVDYESTRTNSAGPNMHGLSKWNITVDSITDGLSNTTMVFELAGRNAVYHAGYRNLASGPSLAPQFDQLEIENQLAFGGGLWADPANGDYFIAGRELSDGSGRHTGNKLINKSNMRTSAAGGGSYYYGYGCGPYGFHRSGANVLMCDGSVRTFSENIDAALLCSLVGARDGLAVGNEELSVGLA